MDLGLTNATAVVVGGGRGMGLAAARCLADDGAGAYPHSRPPQAELPPEAKVQLENAYRRLGLVDAAPMALTSPVEQ